MPGYVRAPIEIGAYSFIGPHSVVEAGSRIGKGVVVCAHSRVRGEVPDFAIVAGLARRAIGDVRTTRRPPAGAAPGTGRPVRRLGG